MRPNALNLSIMESQMERVLGALTGLERVVVNLQTDHWQARDDGQVAKSLMEGTVHQVATATVHAGRSRSRRKADEEGVELTSFKPPPTPPRMPASMASSVASNLYTNRSVVAREVARRAARFGAGAGTEAVDMDITEATALLSQEMESVKL